jgi:formate dehydrogenase major subunit
MPKLKIDGKEVVVAEGTTILDAARRNGIEIPTLCHHPDLSRWGGCRLCVVEIDGSPKLAASCVMPVREGMEVVTSNPRITEARKIILEFLFAERNHNCMICPLSGACELQQLAYSLQMDHLTVAPSFDRFPVDLTSEYIGIDHNRCVLCGRCIRACSEKAGARVLGFHNRGPKTLIGLDLDESREESTCVNCGVCVQVCPTGALYSRYRTHYSVLGHKGKNRVKIDSLCPACGMMCPTRAVVAENVLIEIGGDLSGTPDRPDQGQLCPRGRFEPLKNGKPRLTKPMVRAKSGKWEETSWESALDLIAGSLDGGKKRVFGLASSGCSNEELYLFRELMKGIKASGLDTFDGIQRRTIVEAFRRIGKTYPEADWRHLSSADFILIVGADPAESHPVLASRIRKRMLEAGAVLAAVGPDDPFEPWSEHYIPVLPGEAASTVSALIGALEEGTEAPEHAGIAELAKAFRKSENPIIVTGAGITGAGDAVALSRLMDLALLKGLLPGETMRLMVLRSGGNATGAEALGIPSKEDSLSAVGRWDAGIVLFAGEDLSDNGAAERIPPAGFLAAISPYLTEGLKERASVLIPKPTWLEEAGTFTGVKGTGSRFKPEILKPAEEVPKTWETLLALGGRAGVDPEPETFDVLRARAGGADRE